MSTVGAVETGGDAIFMQPNELRNILASETIPVLCRPCSLKQFRNRNMKTCFQVQFNISTKERQMKRKN